MSLVAALRGRIDGILVQYYRGPEAAGAFNACLPYAATLFQLRAAFYPVIAANIPAMIERRDTAGLNAMPACRAAATQAWGSYFTGLKRCGNALYSASVMGPPCGESLGSMIGQEASTPATE